MAYNIPKNRFQIKSKYQGGNNHNTPSLVNKSPKDLISYQEQQDLNGFLNKPLFTKENHGRGQAIGTSLISQKGFGISKEDLKAHFLIAGSTRRGKSYFTSILTKILAQNTSVILLDPHGTLADQVIEFLSYDHKNITNSDRIIYWDINSKENVIGYNPLQKKPQFNVAKQVDIVMKACLRVWGQDSFSETPTLERWLYTGFSILIRLGYTFLEAEHLFSLVPNDKQKAILSQARKLIKDKYRDEKYIDESNWLEKNIVESLTQEFAWLEKQSARIRQQEMGSSHNRIFKFLRDETIQTILGQREGIDLLEIMDEKKILIVNLNPATVSEEASKLLAVMMSNEIAELANSRERRDRDVYVILDEFSTISSRSIEKGLSQSGKFGIWWVLITQFLEQIKNIDPLVLDAALTNCDNKVFFGGMTKADCEITGDMAFAGALNLQEPKQYKKVFDPVLEWMEVHSSGSSRGGSTSKSETETHGDSLTSIHTKSNGSSSTVTKIDTKSKSNKVGKSKGSSNGGGTSSGSYNNSGYGRNYSASMMDRNLNYSYSDGRGDSSSTNENWGNHKSESIEEGSSETEGINKANGENENFTTGKNETVIKQEAKGVTDTENYAVNESTTLQPVTTHKERMEVSQLYSLEEQKHKLHSMIHLLPPGVAAVKIGRYSPDVLAIHSLNERAYNTLGDYLREEISKNEYLIPYEQAVMNIVKNQKEFNEMVIHETMPTVSPEMNENTKNQNNNGHSKNEDDDSFGL